MTTDRWTRIEALFEAALECEGDERERLLAEAERAQPEVTREVRELLASAAASEGFLETPALPRPLVFEDFVGRELGGFTVGALLGRGGMGAVFAAEQRSPQRRAALKVQAVAGASSARRRRFEVESELLARLEHPAIARVYASGIESVDGNPAPWFAMELVDGARDLLSYAVEERLGARERAALFLEFADALRYAHGRGVLHRDLKPSNLLVDQTGRPKLIDFGIGRELDSDTTQTARTVLTLEGELLGTIAYMAPEQVAGGETDARTDVHGLGLVLYELLCDRPPRDLGGRPLLEAARAIEETAPAPPREAIESLGGDVEWVLATALARDPEERYPTVDALAGDLVALLEGRPVGVGPPTWSYRAKRFVGRHKLAVATAATFVLVLVSSTAVSLLALGRALESEALALREQQATEAALGLAEQRRREAETDAARAVDARDFMRQLVVAPSPYNDGLQVKLVDLLEDRSRAIEDAVSSDPRLELTQRTSLAEIYFGLGLYTRSLHQAESGLALAEVVDRPEASEVDELRSVAARALTALSRFDEAGVLVARRVEDGVGRPWSSNARIAEVVYLEAAGRVNESEALARGLLDEPEFGERAAVTVALAETLYRSGRTEEAEALYREGLALARGADEVSQVLVTGAINGLGLIELDRGDGEAALRRYRELLPQVSELFGPTHPMTLTVSGNLAAALRAVGALEEALAMQGELLAGVAERLGEASSSYLAIRGNLAATHKELGDLETAQAITAEVLAGQREALGDGHPDTLKSAINNARFLELLGRPAEAIPAFELARAMAVDQRGGRDRESIAMGSELANMLLSQGDFEAGVAVLEPLAPIAAEVLEPGEPTAWRVPNNLAGAYRELGRYEDAVATYGAALVAVGVDPPDASPAGLFVLGNLAKTKQRQGQWDEAIALLERVAEGYAQRYGDRVPPSLQADADLAKARFDRGEPAAAAEAFAGVLERAEGVYPPGHWKPSTWRGRFGEALEASGQLEAARAELQRALDELTESVGAESDRTAGVAAALERVARALESGD